MEQKYIFGYLIDNIERTPWNVCYKCLRSAQDPAREQYRKEVLHKLQLRLAEGAEDSREVGFNLEITRLFYIFRVKVDLLESVLNKYNEVRDEFDTLSFLGGLGD